MGIIELILHERHTHLRGGGKLQADLLLDECHMDLLLKDLRYDPSFGKIFGLRVRQSYDPNLIGVRIVERDEVAA